MHRLALRIKKTLLLMALVLAASFEAQSENRLSISILPRSLEEQLIEGPTKVELSGEIDADAPRRLAETLSRVTTSWLMVYINSPGGSLSAGMEIGRLLRRMNATTYVGGASREGYVSKPGGCFSACSFAFLGGAYRYIPEGSVFGVHRASRTSPAADDLDAGQIISAIIGAYIREMGVNSALLDLSVKAGRDGIYKLSKQELEQLKVVNNGRKPPTWIIDVIEGGTYLKGEQETLYGTGKMSILCDRNVINLMSSYTAGEKSKLIAAGGWVHSVFVDQDVLPLPRPVRLEARDEQIYSLFLLQREIARKMISAGSVGHAMQMSREAPTFVGYRIDVDASSQTRFSTFMRNCLRLDKN